MSEADCFTHLSQTPIIHKQQAPLLTGAWDAERGGPLQGGRWPPSDSVTGLLPRRARASAPNTLQITTEGERNMGERGASGGRRAETGRPPLLHLHLLFLKTTHVPVPALRNEAQTV